MTLPSFFPTPPHPPLLPLPSFLPAAYLVGLLVSPNILGVISSISKANSILQGKLRAQRIARKSSANQISALNFRRRFNEVQTMLALAPSCSMASLSLPLSSLPRSQKRAICELAERANRGEAPLCVAPRVPSEPSLRCSF